MHYQRRLDGLISVTIDSNVWNLFHRLGLSLANELPPERFKLFIPREVEIEIEAIPDRPDKANLIRYIRTQIVEGPVKTAAVFGFARQADGPERRGGFGFGTFQGENEREYYAAVRSQLVGKSVKNSQLSNNEADAALGANSLSSVVLTYDVARGPLKFAREHGGKVLDMKMFEGSGMTLADYVVACHELP